MPLKVEKRDIFVCAAIWFQAPRDGVGAKKRRAVAKMKVEESFLNAYNTRFLNEATNSLST